MRTQHKFALTVLAMLIVVIVLMIRNVGTDKTDAPSELTAFTYTKILDNMDLSSSFIIKVQYKGEYKHLGESKQYAAAYARTNINGEPHLVFEIKLHPDFNGTRDDYKIHLSYIEKQAP